MPEDVNEPSHAEGEFESIHEHLPTVPVSAGPGSTHQDSPVPDSTVAEAVAR